MTINEMRELVQSLRPDVGLTLHLADGRNLRVPHTDYLFFPPAGSNIVVATESGTLRVIDTGLVTELELPR